MSYEVSNVLADAMLALMGLAGVVAVGAVAWATVASLRKRTAGVPRRENGVPIRRVALATLGGTSIVMLLSFLLASTQPVVTGGTLFADGFWLRVADMFIHTVLVLMGVAAVAYLYAETRSGNGSSQPAKNHAEEGMTTAE